jgi:hypothetical protein
VLDLYEASKPKPIEQVSTPSLWQRATTSFLPNVDTGNRALNWGYSRLVQPLVSPVGMATLPLGFLGQGARAILGAAGATMSAASMPQLFRNFYENQDAESLADIGLSGLGLAGGTALARNSIMPRAGKMPVMPDIVDAPPPKQLLASNPKAMPAVAGADIVPDPIHRINTSIPQPPKIAVEKLTIPAKSVGSPDVPKLDAMSTLLGEPPAGTFGISNRGEMFPTVPSRLQSSTNQRVIDALLPSRTKQLIGQVGVSNPAVVVSKLKIPQPDKVLSQTRTGLTAAAQEARDAALANVDEWGRVNVPVVARSKNPVIDAGIKSKNPNLSKTSLEADKLLAQAKSAQSQPSEATASAASQKLSIPEKLFQSGTKSLEKLGAKALADKINRIRADADRLTGEAEANIRKFTDTLTKQEKQNFGNYVENPDTIPNDRVRRAVDAYNIEVEKSGIYAENAKLHVVNARGEKLPFQRIKDKYWARQYPEGYFDGPAGRETLFNILVKDGVDPKEAKKIVEGVAKFGERFIDSQHTRQYYRIPGYRTDVDAAFKHLRDIYRRSQEAIELGVDDINDPNTAALIKASKNPQQVTEILEQQLGRTRHDVDAMKAVHAINSAEAAISLPFAAVGNFSQRFAVPLKMNMIDFAKALKNYIFDYNKTKESAMRSGALEPVQSVFRAEGGQGLISKLYGLTSTEEGNRIIAAEGGKLEALRAFSKLKSNPNDKGAAARLKDLLIDDVGDVIKQDTLTPEQIARAQYRMAQITQGLTDPVDLPVYWNRSPWMKLPTFLRRFAFQQSRFMKDAIMENPKRNIPLALGIYTLIGEGVGDVRAGIKTIIAQPFKEEDTPFIDELKNAIIDERAPEDSIVAQLAPETVSWLASRVANNLTNAFALGLAEDAMNAMLSGNPAAGLEFLVGKAASDAVKVGRAITELNPKKFGREVTSISPLTRPIGKEIFKADEEKPSLRPRRPSSIRR